MTVFDVNMMEYQTPSLCGQTITEHQAGTTDTGQLISASDNHSSITTTIHSCQYFDLL